MVIGGSVFSRTDVHKTTWRPPDPATENQIDHVCTGQKSRRSPQDVEDKRDADASSGQHLVMATLNSFLTITRKFSVMTGTLLYVFGPREHHSELTEEITSLSGRYQRKTLFVVGVSINWVTKRNWQTKVLDTWKVTASSEKC